MFDRDAYNEVIESALLRGENPETAVKDLQRTWPDQCQHREIAATGIPGVFTCLEATCGEKLVIPELGEHAGLDVATEPLEFSEK